MRDRGFWLISIRVLVLLFFITILSRHAFAQTDPVSSSMLLQTTTDEVSGNGTGIWNSVLPIDLLDKQTILPVNMNNLTVVNDPSHILFLPTSDINTQSAAVNQAALLQSSTGLPIQESSTTTDQLLSSQASFGNFTFPATPGEITINTAVQALTNKTISGLSNTLEDIPNSSLVNASIRLVGGNGITITGGDVALGGLVTIANNAGSTVGNILVATGGTIDNVSIGSTTPSSGSFTTVNGLTIMNNGNNALNIAAGKTVVVNNALTFTGTDGTIITFPNESDTMVGVNALQVLTNKTLSASDNTISGLTNLNLSGNAGITNANLSNSSITVNAGTGLSGGSSVSLGGSLTLVNEGVTSLMGTANQVNLTGETGTVTLSLPQSINSSASPTFSSVTLASTASQLIFGTVNAGTISWSPTAQRTLTLPDTTDTLVGEATTNTLTNKTLIAPAINGIIATTGLTLPSFIASGTIVGSGSPSLTNFGSINNITLSAATDGFTLSGGGTARILTMTGADITIGSTIKPTNSGALVIESNGSNPLTLDAGGSAGVNIGTTNASGITIGANATVSANKTFAVTTADKLTVGGTIIPQSIPLEVPLLSTVVTEPVFIADTTYQVVGVMCVPSVLSVSGTLQVTVDSGTTAAGGGTSQLQSAISLSGTANTVVDGTLIGSPTTITTGDRVSVKFGGLLTGLLGDCTIYIKRV